MIDCAAQWYVKFEVLILQLLESSGNSMFLQHLISLPSTAGMLDALMQGTLENNTFQSVMLNAGVLGDLASQEKQDLIGNLEKAMDFGADGLTFTSLSGKSSARLGTQQLEFLAGLGADSVVVAVFGLLQTITASYLQIGQSAQSPRLCLGEMVLEYQASTSNLTCRRV